MDTTAKESTHIVLVLICLTVFVGFIATAFLFISQQMGNSTRYIGENDINVNASLIDADYPIIEVENQRVEQNEVFDPMEYVKVSDAKYGDLTSSVNVVGEVDTSTKGVYEILYQVRNPLGLKSTKWINVIVD